jgi:hypothetical protein
MKNTPKLALKQTNISYLFKAYNKARPVAEEGVMSNHSLKKALGLAQDQERFEAKMEEYGTTDRFCTCQGYEVHKHCYHLYAVWLRMRANQMREDDRLEQMGKMLDDRMPAYA